MSTTTAAPPGPEVAAPDEGRAPLRVAALLERRKTDAYVLRTAIGLCDPRVAATLRVVYVQPYVQTVVAAEVPTCDTFVHKDDSEHLRVKVEAMLPADVRLEMLVLPLSGAYSRTLATELARGSDAVVVGCRCRPASGHRLWCPVRHVTRRITQPVVEGRHDVDARIPA